jgi:hypothetical protein
MNAHVLSIVFIVPFFAAVVWGLRSAFEGTSKQWLSVGLTVYIIVYIAIFGYRFHVIH